MTTKNFNKGFTAAYNSVPHGEARQAKKDLMEILGIKSNAAFYLYKTGRMIPAADKAQAVIQYFKKKGITNVYE